MCANAQVWFLLCRDCHSTLNSQNPKGVLQVRFSLFPSDPSKIQYYKGKENRSIFNHCRLIRMMRGFSLSCNCSEETRGKRVHRGQNYCPDVATIQQICRDSSWIMQKNLADIMKHQYLIFFFLS